MRPSLPGRGSPYDPVVLRTVETALPVDLGLTLGPLRHGGRADPCVAIGPGGVWRASRWSGGAATTHLRALGPTVVEVRAWGPGAEDALAAAPDLLGAADTDGDLTSSAHDVVRRMARSRPGLRIGRTANVLEALVPTILGQKVPGHTARAAYVAMVRAHGERAPEADGSGAPALLVPPTAQWLADQPSWAWHRWGVEQRRATTIRTAALAASRCTDACRLATVPGVGPWTVAEVAMTAFGDPDAVSVGDYWLKHWVCHTLAGEPRGTDERMLELLRPWAGQRGRVCRLIMVAGTAPPRYGPRLRVPDIRDL
jgi:3-methyladenine DNA glycosylase/8-oxoguanine DNA glycosylase